MYKETDEYIENVKVYLIETFGEIKPAWLPLLDLLRFQYDLFLMAKENILENGIQINGRTNSCVKVQQDALVQIGKLQMSLGISPYYAIKLKMTQPKDGGDDDFIKNLMND